MTAQYELQWASGSSKFYFDGSLIATIDTNVPTAPSAFLWNSVSTQFSSMFILFHANEY